MPTVFVCFILCEQVLTGVAAKRKVVLMMKLGTMSGAQQGIMLSDLLRDYHQDRSQLDPPARGLRTPMNTASASYGAAGADCEGTDQTYC